MMALPIYNEWRSSQITLEESHAILVHWIYLNLAAADRILHLGTP